MRRRLLLTPTLLRAVLLRRRRMAPAAVGHGHDVRPVLEGLVEAADATLDVLVSVDREWHDGLRNS